ncbi:MAG TPA: K(+)-transporting ATPase subunit C [Fimbriimonas sp.]|nr:K(+)-transporting ATPase subunit C [Fimbriimonas sp.]
MKTFRSAVVLTLFFVVVTGILFPLTITAIAQSTMPVKANGSLVTRDGKVVGSHLIGQNFAGAKYFHPRPSNAGAGYDANNSSGTNLGPTNPKLLEGAEGFDGVKQLAEKYRIVNGLEADVEVPADAVTRSASGLDPHISVRNAELQADRVAKARGVSIELVKQAIRECTEPAFVGVFGDTGVNVLLLNLALDKQK